MTDDPDDGARLEDFASGRAGGGSGPDVMAGLAALAVEVGKLRRHLEGTDETATLLGTEVQALAALSGEVGDLAEAVAELLKTDPAKPPRPTDWAHIPAPDRPQQMGELVTWVRNVLLVGWPSARSSIRACWPRHVEIINNLLWLRTAWQTAYDHPKGAAHHAADFHHWLTEVTARAKEITRGCPRPGEDQEHLPHLVDLPPRDDTPALRQAERDAVLGYLHVLLPKATNPNDPESAAAAQAEFHLIRADWQISEEEYAAYQRALEISMKQEHDSSQPPAEEDDNDTTT